MKARIIDLDKDLDTLNKWWDSHGWDRGSIGLISDLGIIAGNSKEDLVAGWLYETNSRLMLIGWFISNKASNPEERGKALDELFNKAEEIGKQKGYLGITGYSNKDRVINRMEKLGYIKGDLNMTQTIKIFKE